MQEGTIKLSITTPYGVIFDDHVKSVYMPGVEGEFGVLVGHCNFLSLLTAGVVDVHKLDGSNEMVAINWGYAKVDENSVDILANGAVAIIGENPNQISKAISDAKGLLESAASSDVVLTSVMSKIEANAKNIVV